MSTRTAEVAQTDRMCHNCGRPKSHRWHTEYPECTYSVAQPETLWTAVLEEAVEKAAAEIGVDWRTAWLAMYDHFHRRH